MKNLLILLVMVVTGCGTEALVDSQKAKDASTPASDQLFAKPVDADAIPITGYISPINISVDGVFYVDSEDFYTQEVERLSKMVKEQYPKHSLFFDAEVGLRDFKQGLSVFMVAASGQGVADETMVNGRGQFIFNLPAKTDLTQAYIVRAYKRIGMRLQKDQEVISWCYNLYAEENVVLEKDKPMILRDFNTKVTTYQCQTPKTSGISLPYPDMPGVPVKEAFENSETYVGYGPLPKAKAASKTPVVTPSGGADEPAAQATADTEISSEK